MKVTLKNGSTISIGEPTEAEKLHGLFTPQQVRAVTEAFEERRFHIKPEKTYPWDKPNKPEVLAESVPIENDSKAFRRMVRSEKKRIKKLKHAGVREEDWGGSHEI